MAFIKGPIVIKNPGNVADAIRKQFGNQQTGSVKLPFTATGWKSTKMPSMDVIGIDSKVAVSQSELDTVPVVKPTPVVEPIPVEEPIVVPVYVPEVVAEPESESDVMVEKQKKKKRRLI